MVDFAHVELIATDFEFVLLTPYEQVTTFDVHTRIVWRQFYIPLSSRTHLVLCYPSEVSAMVLMFLTVSITYQKEMLKDDAIQVNTGRAR